MLSGASTELPLRLLYGCTCRMLQIVIINSQQKLEAAILTTLQASPSEPVKAKAVRLLENLFDKGDGRAAVPMIEQILGQCTCMRKTHARTHTHRQHHRGWDTHARTHAHTHTRTATHTLTLTHTHTHNKHTHTTRSACARFRARRSV